MVAVQGFAQSKRPTAPEKLQPPSSQDLLLHAYGQGHQVYVCKDLSDHYAWTLKEPEAQLRDTQGKLVGRHFAGPTWAADDGSRVIGQVVANLPSPDALSIPWLLLTAKEHIGSGRMTPVMSIQRLNTKAGVAPRSPCDQPRKGTIVRVPYSAEYYFYGKVKLPK